MKRWLARAIGLVLSFGPLICWSGIAVVPSPETNELFGGAAATIEVRFRNSSPAAEQVDISVQLVQLASSIAAPFGRPRQWRRLEVLPHQTVVEQVALELPLVRAKTIFLARWLAASGAVVGQTPIVVYPTNLLARSVVGSDQRVFVCDLLHQVAPLLSAAGIPFEEVNFQDLDQLEKPAAGSLVMINADKAVSIPEIGRMTSVLLDQGHNIVLFRSGAHDSVWVRSVIERGNARAIIMPAKLLSDIHHKPGAQIMFLDLLRLAGKPPVDSIKTVIGLLQ